MSLNDVARGFLEARTAGDREALLDEALSWTVVGNGPLAGTYHGKSGFLDELMGQVAPRFVPGSNRVKVHAIYEDPKAGVAIAEITETGKLVEGGAYHNDVAIFFHISDGRIREVREYMDLRPVSRLIGAP